MDVTRIHTLLVVIINSIVVKYSSFHARKFQKSELFHDKTDQDKSVP